MEPILDRTIIGKVVTLEQNRLLRLDSEPREVVEHCTGERRRAAGDIDILDPDQEAPAPLPRHIEVEKGRIGVSEMKPSIRARRKTEAHHARAPCERSW